MSAEYFVDTNVLVHVFDTSEPEKQKTAQELLARQGAVGNLCLSTQVLQEFFVAATRKLRQPVPASVAEEFVRQLAEYPVVTVGADLVLQAIRRHREEMLSFRDGLIVEAAIQSGCLVLLSEDMKDGRRVGAMRIENPFVSRGQ
ncbi:MAG: PIN domain-containing protein [Betaproteobacteria bacterium]|nr:PIN domain-containing protein [Betaproteobacteria bacterium]